MKSASRSILIWYCNIFHHNTIFVPFFCPWFVCPSAVCMQGCSACCSTAANLSVWTGRFWVKGVAGHSVLILSPSSHATAQQFCLVSSLIHGLGVFNMLLPHLSQTQHRKITPGTNLSRSFSQKKLTLNSTTPDTCVSTVHKIIHLCALEQKSIYSCVEFMYAWSTFYRFLQCVTEKILAYSLQCLKFLLSSQIFVVMNTVASVNL